MTKNTTLLIILFVIFSCVSNKKTKETGPESSKQPNQKLWGIDISHYQEIYDWDKIKEQKPEFVFIKTSEGSTIKDDKYLTFYEKFRELKIPVGSYHFFTYTSNGKSQALNFLSVARYRRGDLPLVLDAEYAKKMPDSRIVTRELTAFLTTVKKETGCNPIIYCPYSYYLKYIKNIITTKSKLWIVDYKEEPDCNWTFWQTTEKYKMPGIKGFVDFNLFKGSNEDLKKLLK